MPISKEQLGSIIANKAAALCRPENDNARAVSRGQINERMMDGGPDPSAYDADAARWDAMFSSAAEEDYAPAPVSRDINYSNQSGDFSRMPDAIKKSMLEHRIDVSALGNTSVLDQMNIKAKPMTAPTQKKQAMNEQQYSYPQPAYQGGNVDYSVIKAIVSECIREYFEKQPLNEGSLKTIYLKKGKISIIDDHGNVYGAKLEKKGNVNDKKGED